MTAMEGKLNLLAAELDLLEANQPQSLSTLVEHPMLQRGLIKTIENVIEYCLDLGRMLIRENAWETPERYRDIITTLTSHGILPAEKQEIYYRIVGFRNLVVHNYEKVDAVIVYGILTKHIEDLRLFGRAIARVALRSQDRS